MVDAYQAIVAWHFLASGKKINMLKKKKTSSQSVFAAREEKAKLPLGRITEIGVLDFSHLYRIHSRDTDVYY